MWSVLALRLSPEAEQVWRARKREWESAAEAARARAANERRAKVLAKDKPMGKGDTFSMRVEGEWDQLRVLEVSDALSHRANYGAIKVYKCESVKSGKTYPRVDLSSWRGAEGACQVKCVKRAPQETPTAPAAVPTALDQRNAAQAALTAKHQTRSRVACWMRYRRVGGDDDPMRARAD